MAAAPFFCVRLNYPGGNSSSGSRRTNLRSNMDAAEYKHVVLGLIFLKYISDAFAETHAALGADRKGGADPEDPDEYRAVNVFWVPAEARWPHLAANAKQPTVGKTVDDAMLAVERDPPRSRACGRRTTPTRAWTSTASANSST